jgi:intracellular sulfur oxidation DsrE/DsrF family protein
LWLFHWDALASRFKPVLDKIALKQKARHRLTLLACAKSVEAFVKGNDMAAELEKKKAAGITYKVCGLSL